MSIPAVSPRPIELPPIPTTPPPAQADAAEILTAWLTTHANPTLSNPTPSAVEALLHPHASTHWRDHLALNFEHRTVYTASSIATFLLSSKNRIQSITLHGAAFVAPIDFEKRIPAVWGFVDITTAIGTGRGVVKLLPDDQGVYRAWSIYTVLLALHAFPEKTCHQRPMGVAHGSNPGRKTWVEQRREQVEYANREPVVVVIGAGQSGLMVAARLKMLGIPTLVVERNDRVGDNWRQRYKQLVLHDPVWYDHMPYLPFPANWPVFAPKDKLADWFEMYAATMELDVWLGAEVKNTEWDEAGKEWRVEVTRKGGEKRAVRPRHLVIATGHSGEPFVPAFEGSESFGGLLCHSSKFPGAGLQDGKGRKAVVVGTGNSGHDIAQDYYEHGYDVTMVQRGETYVLNTEIGFELALGGIYDENGPPTEDADLLVQSTAISLLKRNHTLLTKEVCRRDRENIDALKKAGFGFGLGPDDAGFMALYLERGGGYYLDVGAAALLASGKIKIKRGSVAGVTPAGLRFLDGSELEADEIVLATGYANMVSTAERILGKENMKGCQEVWGVDERGEIRGMYERNGDTGRLWFVGGNLALTRFFSRGLALGIVAVEAGLT